MESPIQKSLLSFIKDLTNWGALLYQNCARIQRFHFIEDSFERKADSPICWKR